MKVAFRYDDASADGTRGGAELAMDEFKACAPGHVEIVDVPAADVLVVGNCVDAAADLPTEAAGKRIIRFHHDIATDEPPEILRWLTRKAEHIFTSPAHVERYPVPGVTEAAIIPPVPALADFKPNRRKGKRAGLVTVGNWQAPGKGGNLVSELAFRAGRELISYGPGAWPPQGSHVDNRGPVPHEELPALLAGFKEFVYLPTNFEPFGRTVVEAWAAGTMVSTNDNVGGTYWLEHDPAALWSAGEDFWTLVAPND